jgi:hypothetical protein
VQQKAESPEKSLAPLLIDPKDELPIKSEQPLDSQLQNESMSMLLCDETIPSSPAPNHQSIIPNVKRVYHNAAFLQPQNVTVAAAISFSSGGGGGQDNNKPSSSTEIMYTTIEKSRGGSVQAAATSTTGTAGKTTSDSSPRDSLSQDDSKSDSEDLKKTGELKERKVGWVKFWSNLFLEFCSSRDVPVAQEAKATAQTVGE